MHHVGMSLDQYLESLLDTIVCGYLGAFPQDITLMGMWNLHDVGLLDLVIVSWPCQGHFQASIMMVFLTMIKIFWRATMNVVTSIAHSKTTIYLPFGKCPSIRCVVAWNHNQCAQDPFDVTSTKIGYGLI